MSIEDRRHLVYANTPQGQESSSSDTESSSQRRRYRTRQYIREQDRTQERHQTTHEFLEEYNKRIRVEAAFGTEQKTNEFRHILGSKLKQDVKEIDAKLHERRIQRLRQTYNEDKKLDWMFDTPDV